MSKQPVIIIGMHRSGTTLLTELLEKCGLFVGRKKFGNKEAVFFQEINRWWLFQARTFWDTPSAFRNIHPTFVDQAQKVFDWRASSYHLSKYLGLVGAIRYKNFKRINFPWGWKDPVNSITIDIWMQIFPEASIINITRNPLDVAMSLKTREESRIRSFTNYRKVSKKEKELIYKPTYNQSYRVLNLKEGVKLGTEYLELNKKSLNQYNNHYQLNYEELLAAPSTQLKELLRFLNLDVSEEKINTIVKNIEPYKANKYIYNDSLRTIYYEMKLESLFLEYGFSTPEKLEV